MIGLNVVEVGWRAVTDNLRGENGEGFETVVCLVGIFEIDGGR